MKSYTHLQRFTRATLLVVSAIIVHGQTTAPNPATPEDPAEDEAIVLSPFVVSTDEDEGYAAQYTLAGTRIRTDIKDVGSSITVVTAKMLSDTGTTNATQLLVYTPNTEVVGQGGNFLNTGDSQYAGQVRYGSSRVRGLSDADTTRDFFLTNIPWDSYNTGRIDIQRGPNSILFGIGSPAGIINASINHAAFKNSYKLENKLDNYGTVRFSGDFNQVVIDQQLAIRVAFLSDDTKYRQEPAFRNDKRLFAALRWDPAFLNRGSMKTSFEANYEDGEIEANLFRSAPPTDYFTPWFSAGMQPLHANGVLFRDGTGADSTPEGFFLGSAADQLSQGGTILAYAQNQPTALSYPHNVASQGQWVGGAFVRGIISKGSAINQKRKGVIPGAAIDAWKATVITDRSIFDSYNTLLDGDTKRENNDFSALNLAFRQSFLDETLGYELAFDYQETHQNGYNYLGTAGYGIAVDTMGTLAGGIIGGSPNPAGGTFTEVPDPVNPNFGKPYVVGARGSGWNWNKNERTSSRFTGFYNLDFNKISGKDSKLGVIFGENIFTGLAGKFEDDTFAANGGDYYLDDASRITIGATPVYILNYLSPQKLSGTNPAGLGLPGLAGLPTLTQGERVLFDDATKTYSTTQFNLLTDFNLPEEQRTYTNGPNKTRRTIETAALVWQGHWFGGNLIPMVAFRQDKSYANQGGVYGADGEFSVGAPSSEVNGRTIFYPYDESYVFGEDSPKTKVESKTYSVVTHTPKKWREKLPGNMDFQLIYNQSENFQPSPGRTDIMNRPLPDPAGETKEYGFAISMMNDKVYLKVVHYETKQTDADIGQFFEGNISSIAAQEVWARSGATAHKGLKPGGVGPSATGDHSFQVSQIYGYSSDGNPITFKPYGPWARNINPSAINIWDGRMANEPYPVGTVREAYTQAELDATWAIQKAAMDAVLASPPPDDFITANGINRTNFFRTEGPGMFDYGNGAASAVVTGDTESEGTEFELVANPLKGLTVMVNASKTEAKRTSIAQSYLDYIESRRPFFYGPAGDMRIWSAGEADQQIDPYTTNGNASMSVAFRAGVDSPISKFIAATDSLVPELHPWAFNTIANYEFQEGALRGFHVGGGYRWQDKLVTGYPIMEDENGNEAYDLDSPYYGHTQDAVDLWIGYQRRLPRKLHWHIQLNVRNVFANDRLIRSQVNPDGSGSAYRIPEPRTITLTNTISF